MPLTDQQMQDIIVRAAGLYERLEAGVEPAVNEKHAERVERRLRKWREIAGHGDARRFENRLSWDGWKEEDVRRVLRETRLPASVDTPAWADLIRDAIVFIENLDKTPIMKPDRSVCGFLDPEKPIPFEEFLSPFVLYARKRLSEAIPDHYALFSATAHTALERDLLTTLARLTAGTLNLEFSIYRLRSDLDVSLDRFLKPEYLEGCSKEMYLAFIRFLLDQGLIEFLCVYAVLTRLTGTVIGQWIEANAEFMERLHKDLPALQSMFFSDAVRDRVADMTLRLSDSHHGGRTVYALTFESGLRLVYKPRDLGLEKALSNFLLWINARQPPMDLRTVRILSRVTHGWVEFVEHAPCDHADAVKRYYQRAGMTLALLYLLEATDIHCENIIASGEYPVLIDMETLLSPNPGEDQSVWTSAAAAATRRLMLDTILKSGFLPRWMFGPEGRVHDLSALGYAEEQETDYRIPVWRRLNTDRMALDFEYGRTRPRANLPTLHGASQSFELYKDEVEAGFEAMYRWIVDRRAELGADQGPLTAFKDLTQRVVLRNTRYYYQIQESNLIPDLLKDGADWSIGVDRLARKHTGQDRRPLEWPTVAWEHRYYMYLDIPYFESGTTTTGIYHPAISGLFDRSGYDLMTGRLAMMSEADLNRQTRLIRAVCMARAPVAVYTTEYEEDRSLRHLDIAPLSPEQKTNRSLAIGEWLREKAVQGKDGSLAWIGFDYIPSADRYQLSAIGHSLYSGYTGVSFFLAGLYRITRDAMWRDMALAGIKPLTDELRRAAGPSPFLDAMPVGGATGLGGLLYAFTRMGEWLDDGALIADACKACAYLTKERISQDALYDVIGGAAGAALGLLALHGQTRDAEALDRAVDCGRHILDKRTVFSTGHRVWKTVAGVPLTGFAHGAAGMACALLRLYSATGEAVFREAAEEAIAFERSVYNAKEKNWPDYRQQSLDADGHATCRTQWCHGAPGVGLARLDGLHAVDTEQAREEIAAALSTTVGFGVRGFDHVCCGSFGRADVLFEAGRRMSQPAWIAAAEDLTVRVLTRVERAGCFRLFENLADDAFSPGLFQGMAGIGYQLLRQAHPDELPSFILWG